MSDITYDLYKCNLENLKTLSAKAALILERRILELHELCCSVEETMKSSYGNIDNIYELLSLFSEEYQPSDFQVHSECLPINIDIITRNLSLLSSTDKCIFCDLLVSRDSKGSFPITEESFITNKTAGETFTYVKNPISDEAYDVFTENLYDPRVFYSKTFKEAVHKVIDGVVDFCLLPLEEKGDRIHSVNELILSHDLKINEVTPVFGLDGTADMKYAKISKYLNLPYKASGDDRYLEIRLPTDTEITVGQIISAAEVFGNSVYRINTETLKSEGEDRNYYSVVFRDDKDGFAKILTYLTLFTGDYIPVGIYKNLE